MTSPEHGGKEEFVPDEVHKHGGALDATQAALRPWMGPVLQTQEASDHITGRPDPEGTAQSDRETFENIVQPQPEGEK